MWDNVRVYDINEVGWIRSGWIREFESHTVKRSLTVPDSDCWGSIPSHFDFISMQVSCISESSGIVSGLTSRYYLNTFDLV